MMLAFTTASVGCASSRSAARRSAPGPYQVSSSQKATYGVETARTPTLRPTSAQVLAGREQRRARVPGAHHGARPVTGAVVDHDDRRALRQTLHSRQGAVQLGRPVVRDDDDTDPVVLHSSPPSHLVLAAARPSARTSHDLC
jgi:hypothetical protein